MDVTTRGGGVIASVLAFLLVTAAVAPFAVGVASAETYSQTVSGSPKFVDVDVTPYSGTFTVSIYTDDVGKLPGGAPYLLYRKEMTKSGFNTLTFGNYGAYDNVTVEIEGVSETFTATADSGWTAGVSKYLGGTGGDEDLNCGFYEGTANFIQAGTGNIDCSGTPATESINFSDTDANQTKIDIYESGLAFASQNEVLGSVRSNYLEDTKSIALMVGKNEYIRQLENGSSESVARSKARTAVYDYYATKQVNLIKQYNSSVSHWVYLNSVAANETGITAHEYVNLTNVNGVYGLYGEVDETFGTENTLVNGSNVGVLGVEYVAQNGKRRNVSMTQRNARSSGGSWGSYNPPTFVVQEAPTKSGDVVILNGSEMNTTWFEIGTQADTVAAEVSTFVNSTYDAYQQGQINESDLVDPYLASRNYAPNSGFQTWSLATYQSLGANGPMNLSDVGHMTVVDEETNTSYNGILLSDGLPENDTFDVGVTYNASNLTGVQAVVTNSERVELEGEFTITEAVTVAGENQTSVTYRNVTYETADISEFQSLVTQLSELRAAIEARETSLSSGGGGFGFGDLGTDGIAIIALAGAGLYILGSRN